MLDYLKEESRSDVEPSSEMMHEDDLELYTISNHIFGLDAVDIAGSNDSSSDSELHYVCNSANYDETQEIII